MITNPISRSIGLGICIAAGTFGCSSNGGVANNGPSTNSTAATGGGTSANTSSGANLGGTTNVNTQAGGTTGATMGGTSVSAGGSTSSASAGGNTGIANTGGTTANATTSSTQATGGVANTGGAKANTGGKSSTGGSSASGNTGGKSSAGGTSTGGTKATGGSSAQSSTCTITATSSVSDKIGPVGIVTFTVSGTASLDSAQIDFGLDTNYGLTAPVNATTASSNYRTLLLGMKINKTYHFRVTGKSGSTTCTSPDYTIDAGGCPTAIKKPTVTTPATDKSKLDGGFLVTESYTTGTTSKDYAYILDGDGELVWCYQPSGFGDLTATRMSWDGKWMWMVHGNVPSGTAHMGRVTMDGQTFEDLSSKFAGLNHDADVVTNDDAVVFIAYGSGGSTSGCDDVKEWKPDGTVRTIINLATVFSDGKACHANAIKYDRSDDTIVVSDDTHNGYFKTDRQGNVKWVFGGGTFNSFDKSNTSNSTWSFQHNMHLIGPDSAGAYHILFFNNGYNVGGAAHAVAREFKLDVTAKTTSEVWTYDSNPDISNMVMGDVQRLSNGNTLIAYSTAGAIHEVDASKTLLQTLTWSGGQIGYVTKRKTLYGPPPR